MNEDLVVSASSNWIFRFNYRLHNNHHWYIHKNLIGWIRLRTACVFGKLLNNELCCCWETNLPPCIKVVYVWADQVWRWKTVYIEMGHSKLRGTKNPEGSSTPAESSRVFLGDEKIKSDWLPSRNNQFWVADEFFCAPFWLAAGARAESVRKVVKIVNNIR